MSGKQKYQDLLDRWKNGLYILKTYKIKNGTQSQQDFIVYVKNKFPNLFENVKSWRLEVWISMVV